MTKFFNKFKKLCFWPIFGPFSQFWGQKNFFQKIWLSHTTSYTFLVPCQNFKKTNDTIPRKCPDRLKEGQKDRQTLFHRTLWATAMSPKRQKKNNSQENINSHLCTTIYGYWLFCWVLYFIGVCMLVKLPSIFWKKLFLDYQMLRYIYVKIFSLVCSVFIIQ